ncbi:hypothetical protein EXN66_Car015806 [Channa argus]|uniref:Uncharacterized protein n=1 Tax=Channa argus TaxID=215402 RepID=A0A6G1QCI6_CHAAH|nr:hypothetical protein EXN66_Car015806 [Channa argus]
MTKSPYVDSNPPTARQGNPQKMAQCQLHIFHKGSFTVQQCAALKEDVQRQPTT